MSDVLDTTQLVSGVAVLLSFYVGYKYGIKISAEKLTSNTETPSTSSSASNIDAINLFTDMGEYKMMLVVRNDLKMGKGKIAAQCGHAAVGAYQSAVRRYPNIVYKWENSGCPKIAVKIESEKEMMDLRLKAIAKDFNICLIRDAGRTQIEPNSKTVLAIGPALSSQIDELTGHLKLL